MTGTRRGLLAMLRVVGTSAVLTALAVLGMGVATAMAARGHVLTGSFGSPGSGAGQLDEPAGVAANEATGDVYVVDKANNRVEIFNATGSKFEGEFNGSGLGLGMLGSGQLLNEGKAAGSGGLPEEVPSGRFDEPEGIAIDNDPASPSFGDVYVADAERQAIVHNTQTRNPVVDKFSATGEYIGQITRNPNGAPFSENGFRILYGVAVDSHGEVWVEEQNFGGDPPPYSPNGDNDWAVDYSNAVANVWIGFRPTEAQASNGRIVAEAAPGLALDGEGDLYVHNTFGADAIVEFGASGEVINPEVDEEAPTDVATELSSNDVYISHLTNVHRLDASGKSLEALTIPGGHGSSVAVDSATLTVYVADSANGVVDVFGPEPPGAPTVESGSESVRYVTATSASFSAEVNPRSEPFEEATSYSFEYGPCDTPTTCSSSPYVDSVPVPEGVLAANYEPDLVGAHPQDLLPHTAYHMRLVAHNSHPGVAEGEELVFTTQATGAFVLSDGRDWELVSPPNKYGALIQAFFSVSQASLTGGALTYHANAPIEAQPPGNFGSDVQALSGRTATGWESLDIDAPHETTPGHSGTNEYHFFSTDLSMSVLQPAGAFVSSLSGEASEQTPFLRTDFLPGDPTRFCDSSCYTPLVTGAPGVENVPPGTVFGNARVGGGECVAGECGPEFVGASPDASHIILRYGWAPLVEGFPTQSLYEWAGGRLNVVSVLPGGKADISGSLGGGSNGIVRNAVSSDGSRVVWSDGSHLYLRDSAKEETVQLDQAQGGTAVSGVPVFQTASSDESRIFFSASDLFECEILEEAGELKCKLTALTGDAGVAGTIPGVSEDGSYVYFVSGGVLTGTQANEHDETAVAGQPNLYVRHGGVTSLIAVLSSDDSKDWSSVLSSLTARVSPDGHWFAFMSDRPLTGFDNRDAISGKRDGQVFLYHAGENGEGKLVCASCNPTGARPHGTEDRSSLEGLGPGSLSVADAATAALLPGWTSPFYQSRYLSNSGRLFFDSVDALVPQDTNGAEDVYQYEPTGVGGCTDASATFVVASDGCVGLISSGTSEEGSAFLDASESGGDVFFLTTAQLSPLDIDSAIDIYDAHECGRGEDCSPAVSVPVPACEGDACQSPVAAPEDPTPGSLTYQGPGNLFTPVVNTGTRAKPKPSKCGKDFVKRHGGCVRKKAKKRAKRVRRSIGRAG